MNRLTQANAIIRSHVLWAIGGGLIPIPLVDFAAVTAIQLEMLQQLAALYEVDYSKDTAKAFVSALTGTTIARIGASVLKAIPGLGSIIGGASMSVMSGASTYAVGKVAISMFSASRGFNDLNTEDLQNAYEQAYEQGKTYVSHLQNREDEAANIYQTLEKLGKLKNQGILSEEEFQAKKKELLDRL